MPTTVRVTVVGKITLPTVQRIPLGLDRWAVSRAEYDRLTQAVSV